MAMEWSIRCLEPEDAPDISRISGLVGWGQDRTVANDVIRRSGGMVFGAFSGSAMIGVAAAVTYPDAELGFINQVTVDPAWQRRGVASSLLRHLMEKLSGCGTLRLYASEMGRPVYERLGFRAYGRILRCRRSAAKKNDPIAPPPGAEPLTEEELPLICDFDALNFGARRDALLRRLRRRVPEGAWCVRDGSRLLGFILGTPTGIGTIQSADPELSLRLLDFIVGFRGNPGLVLCIREEWYPTLSDRFEMLAPLTAMQYGRELPPPPEAYRSVIGLDVG